MYKLSQEKFLQKATAKHAGKYSYDRSIYTGTFNKVTITCPKHGDFQQVAHFHLAGQGCKKCSIEKLMNFERVNTAIFKERAAILHNNKYGYDKVNYVSSKVNVTITCPVHGDFEQHPVSHLRGYGCSQCADLTRFKNLGHYGHDDFIVKAKGVHNDKYDYSKTRYVDGKTKVTITCPVHGNFEQKPSVHLAGGGCQVCSGVQKLTKEEFLRKANAVHNQTYSYDKFNFVNVRTKGIITCSVHGGFEQRAFNHLRGQGCPVCGTMAISEKARSNTTEFVAKASIVHNGKYDYAKTVYTVSHEKVIITCPIHGDFIQRANSHTNGSGCQACSSSKGELLIKKILTKSSINHIQEHCIPGVKPRFRYDFYLPDHHLFIEFHGGQHYKPIDYFGGEEGFKLTKERDQFKRVIAKGLKIPLLEFNFMHLRRMSEEAFEKAVLRKIARFSHH